MSAAVVYDGVGGGGELFQGKKFWVAQRVPSRNRFLDLLKSNGGDIVPLEQLADIMIADHARKDAPMGSYSWRWIEDSIKNGRLVELESHRIGPALGSVRPVGSGSSIPTRIGRTPFTPEDDRILMNWVTRAERSGAAIKGNKLYEDLARANTRHTSQSWRDRWIKTLQSRPRPTIPKDDMIEEVATSNAPSGTPGPKVSSQGRPIEPSNSSENAKRVVRRHVNEKVLPSQKISSVPQSSSPASVRSFQPTRGIPFTERDKQSLLDIYDDVMNVAEDETIRAWNAWADAHPRHTADEWLKFWVNDVKPLRSPSMSKSKKRVRSVQTIISPNHPPRGAEDEPLAASKTSQSISDFPSEKDFAQKLKTFAETFEIDIEMHPSVCKRPISLFRLWNVVASPNFQGFHNIEATNRWHQVATVLNFNTFRDVTAASELRAIYEQMLSGFAESVDLWRTYQAHGIGDENEVMLEEQAEEDFDDDLEPPPQPPRTNSSPLKPGHSAAPSSGTRNAQLDPPRASKKRKIEGTEKGKERELEVPATPEDLIGLNRETRATPEVSPFNLRHNPHVAHEDELDDEEGVSEPPLHRRLFVRGSPTASAQHAIVEPETQDFHFSSVEEDDDTGEEYHTAPSKQKLHPSQHHSMVALAGSQQDDSSTQSQTDSQRADAALTAFIDQHVALRYPEEIVIQSLVATTMETGDAAVVMEAIYKGNGIPENIQGVWTERDDLAARAGEKSDEFQRITEKHGLEICSKRLQFLKDIGGG